MKLLYFLFFIAVSSCTIKRDAVTTGVEPTNSNHDSKRIMQKIDLTKLQPFSIPTKAWPVKILALFDADSCKQNLINANVYKVTLLQKTDTVYIFEICHDPIWNRLEQTEKGGFIVIPAPAVNSQFLIPASAQIPDSAKYLFGRIRKIKI